MSLCKSIKVQCPTCGHSQKYNYYGSINVTVDKELKKSVRDLSVFRVYCKHCGEKINVLHPMLYHDMDKNLQIWLLPRGTTEEEKAVENKHFREIKSHPPLPDYTTRLVATPFLLVDKVKVFDAGLDDRVIELCKIFMYGDLCDENPQYSNREITDAFFHQFKDGTNAIQYLCVNNDENFTLRIDDEYYSTIANAFKETFEKMPSDAFDEIDQTWAYNAIDFRKTLVADTANVSNIPDVPDTDDAPSVPDSPDSHDTTDTIPAQSTTRNFCHKCGAKLLPESNFCSRCGAKIAN